MTISVTPFESLAAASALASSDEILIRQTRGSATYNRTNPAAVTAYVAANLSKTVCNVPLSLPRFSQPVYNNTLNFINLGINAQNPLMNLSGTNSTNNFLAISGNYNTGGDFTVGGPSTKGKVIAFQLSHSPVIDTKGNTSGYYTFALRIVNTNNANKVDVAISSGFGGIVSVTAPVVGGKTIAAFPTDGPLSPTYNITVYVNLDTGTVGVVINNVDYGLLSNYYTGNTVGGDNSVVTLSPGNYSIGVLGLDYTVAGQSYVGQFVNAQLVTTFSNMGYLPVGATDLNDTWGFVPQSDPMFPVMTLDLTPQNANLALAPINVVDMVNGVLDGTTSITDSSTANNFVLNTIPKSLQAILIGDSTLFQANANLASMTYLIIGAAIANDGLGLFCTEMLGTGKYTYTIDPLYIPGTPIVVFVDSVFNINVQTKNGVFKVNTVSIPTFTQLSMGILNYLNSGDAVTHTLGIDTSTTLDSSSKVFGMTLPAASSMSYTTMIPWTGGITSVPMLGALTVLSSTAPTSTTANSIVNTINAAGYQLSIVPLTGTLTNGASSGTVYWLGVQFDITKAAFTNSYINKECSFSFEFNQNPLPNNPYWFNISSVSNTVAPPVINLSGSFCLDDQLLLNPSSNLNLFISNVPPNELLRVYNATSENLITPTMLMAYNGVWLDFSTANPNITAYLISSNGISNTLGTNKALVDSNAVFNYNNTNIVVVIDPITKTLNLVMVGVPTPSTPTGVANGPTFFGDIIPSGVTTQFNSLVYSLSIANSGINTSEPLYITLSAKTSSGSSLNVNINSLGYTGTTIPSSILPLGLEVPNALPSSIKVGNRFLVTNEGSLVIPNSTNTAPSTITVAAGAVIEVLESLSTNGLVCSITKYNTVQDLQQLIFNNIKTVTLADVLNPFPSDGIYAIQTPLPLILPVLSNSIVNEYYSIPPAYGVYGALPTTGFYSTPVNHGANLKRYIAPGSLVLVDNGNLSVLIANANYDQSLTGGSYPFFESLNGAFINTNGYVSPINIPAMVNTGSVANAQYPAKGMFEFKMGISIPISTPGYIISDFSVDHVIGVYLPQLPATDTTYTQIYPSAINNIAPNYNNVCFVFIDLENMILYSLDSALGVSTPLAEITLPNHITTINVGDVFTFLVTAVPGPTLQIYYNGINITAGNMIALVDPNINSALVPVCGYAPFVTQPMTNPLSNMSDIIVNTGNCMYSYGVDAGTTMFKLPFGEVYPVPLFRSTANNTAAIARAPLIESINNSGQAFSLDSAADSFVSISNNLTVAGNVTIYVLSSNRSYFNRTLIVINNSAGTGILTATFNGVDDIFNIGVVQSIPVGATVYFEIINGNSIIMRPLSAPVKTTPYRYPVPTISGYSGTLITGQTPTAATTVNVGDISVVEFSKTLIQGATFKLAIDVKLDITKPVNLRIQYSGDATVASSNFHLEISTQEITIGSAIATAAYNNVYANLTAPIAGNLAETIVNGVMAANTLASTDSYVNMVILRLGTDTLDTNTGNFQIISIVVEQ